MRVEKLTTIKKGAGGLKRSNGGIGRRSCGYVLRMQVNDISFRFES